MMAKDHPDHHDAEIVMRLYDLRRENVMRESREAINTQFWPRSFEEAYRREVNALAFRNAEWVARECPPGRALFESIQARVRKLAEARLAPAK